MKAIMDLHTHTLAAGHAYSTLLENIDAALAMGLQYLGMSEHGPTSPGGPHNFFFSNYKVIPRIYDREENTGRVIPKPDGSLRLLLPAFIPLPLLREAARRIHWHLSELFRILM